MIINIRGTSGSGKSTAVRQVMDLAHSTDRIYLKDRKNPLLYRLHWPGDKVISIPGHYETACGGCDTIKTYDQLFEIIKQEYKVGHHVLFEGLLVAHDKKRCTELFEWLLRDPLLFQIIELTETLETCLASVEKRRSERKNPPKKPFNPDNTTRRYKEVVRSCEQLEAIGVPVHRYKRDQVLEVIFHQFGIKVMEIA
jgi:ABC-type dipeptide/oligopeptide/nickel transport system ATPase component